MRTGDITCDAVLCHTTFIKHEWTAKIGERKTTPLLPVKRLRPPSLEPAPSVRSAENS
jgi:hypothetical protein